MGIIADRLNARLTDLIERSEQTDRLITEARAEVQEAINELNRTADQLTAN
jgi:hypothetical protein